MERSSRQKIRKDIVEPQNTISQQDIIDTYRLLYAATAEYMLFLSSHETLTKVDPILGHKTQI